MSLPEASPIEVASVAESVDMDALLSQVKSLPASDLFKLMKTALSEAEKKSKATGKTTRGPAAAKPKAEKKTGSMPKGQVPPQLRKPRAWVEFTLKHALENGWESFVVHQKRKDKETGEVIEEEIEMPCSVLHDGAYVYDGSVSDKTPAGKQLIQKDAMSLSKQRWAPKEATGTHPELYAEFEASYVEEAVEVADAASVASSKRVVKKTAAEKEAEAEAKKLQKEEAKAAKKAEREEAKAAKKAAADEEKAAKKAAKEAEKAEKAKPAAAKVPAAAVKKAAAAPVKAAAVTPVKAAAVKAVPQAHSSPAGAAGLVPKKKPAAAVEAWTCPADGMVHPWSYKGKNYLRNSDNEVWIVAPWGSCGEWQGVYLPAEERIDDSVPEPEFEEE